MAFLRGFRVWVRNWVHEQKNGRENSVCVPKVRERTQARREVVNGELGRAPDEMS